jgi:syntaxin 5
MFGKLGTLVQQQHDLAQRIDTNISDALTNLDQTQTELNKYLSKVMSNRGLILKIFLVLVVFVIIVTLFLV